MRILVTGATGFIGTALVQRLCKSGEYTVRCAVRQPPLVAAPGVEHVTIDLESGASAWRAALEGVDAVVHLAARVHVMRETRLEAMGEYRRLNVDGTLAVAGASIEASVKRFVYVSSIKVNGETGVFTADDAPAPSDPYGISKSEAETALKRLAAGTPLEVVIVRPPLVYGPGVRANFAALMRAIEAGVPLPLRSIDNRRSLVGIDNLVDFLVTCLTHPRAAGETFLVSDGEDLSTPALVRRLAGAMNRPARLIPVPPRMLLWIAALAGRRAIAERLLGSLQLDISKSRDRLSWQPPVPVDDGLRRAVTGAP